MKVKVMAGLVLGVLSSAHAEMMFEGGHSGNGGGVHYCIYNQKLPKLEFYDLWEGKNPIDPKTIKPLIILDWDGKTTKEQYLENALKKVAAVKPRLAAALKRALVLYNKLYDPKFHNRKNLVKVEDAHLLFAAEGCSYQQLINWFDNDEALEWYGLEKEVILRDEDVYQALNPRDQAAADFHEAAYKIRRAFDLNEDDSGSVYVRKFVAQVFSTSPIQAKLYDLIGPFNTPKAFKRNDINKNNYSANFTLQYVFSKSCTQTELENAYLELENVNNFNLINPYNGYEPIKPGEKAIIRGASDRYNSYPNVLIYSSTGSACDKQKTEGFQLPYKLKFKAYVCGEVIEFDELTVNPQDAQISKCAGSGQSTSASTYFITEFLTAPI